MGVWIQYLWHVWKGPWYFFSDFVTCRYYDAILSQMHRKDAMPRRDSPGLFKPFLPGAISSSWAGELRFIAPETQRSHFWGGRPCIIFPLPPPVAVFLGPRSTVLVALKWQPYIRVPSCNCFGRTVLRENGTWFLTLETNMEPYEEDDAVEA